MKKTFIILSAGVIAGVAAYAFWKCINSRQSVDMQDHEHNNEKNNAPVSTTVAVDKSAFEVDVECAEYSAATIISERHEEATQIMKDAVDIICKRCEVSKDESQELDQLSDELDALLREE